MQNCHIISNTKYATVCRWLFPLWKYDTMKIYLMILPTLMAQTLATKFIHIKVTMTYDLLPVSMPDPDKMMNCVSEWWRTYSRTYSFSVFKFILNSDLELTIIFNNKMNILDWVIAMIPFYNIIIICDDTRGALLPTWFNFNPNMDK